MKEPRPVGLAWLPILITADGEIVEPPDEEWWMTNFYRKERMG